MSAAAHRFDEIERFNSYARDNSAQMSTLLADVEGIEGIVKAANNLNFDITVSDVREYVRAKSSKGLTEEQLALISGGGSTVTFTSTATVANTVAAAEVIVAAIAAAVAVIVVD